MNFGLAFSYIFKDPDWFKKLILPGLCALIPVIGQFVLIGWAMHVAKNVMEGNAENALPNLEFGEDLKRGFMAFVINLIYGLPMGLFIGIGAAAVALGLGGGAALAGNTSSGDAAMGVGGVIGMICMVCGYGLAGLYGLALAVWGPAALSRYIASGEFGAAFKFKEIWAMIKGNFGAWLLVLVAGLLTGLIAPLGSIACGLGVLLTAPFALAFQQHMVGQAYVVSTTPKLGEVEVL